MKKLNDEQMGKIMNILNKGYGDSWNNNYGIFRPMKEWGKLDWLQYVVVSIVFVLGIVKASEIYDNLVDRLEMAYIRKKNESCMTNKMDIDDEEDNEE